MTTLEQLHADVAADKLIEAVRVLAEVLAGDDYSDRAVAWEKYCQRTTEQRLRDP